MVSRLQTLVGGRNPPDCIAAHDGRGSLRVIAPAIHTRGASGPAAPFRELSGSNAELLEVVVEMPRLQAAPFATGDLAEHRPPPPPVLDLPGDEAVDELEGLLSLGLEIT